MEFRLTMTQMPVLLASLMAVVGCSPYRSAHFSFDAELEHYKTAATAIEYADVDSATYGETAATPPPITLSDGPTQYWELSLQAAIESALANSTVLRDLGGLLLQSPENVQTSQTPSIVETDPRFGVEAALSAFDASFASNLFFENNDRALNNVFFGGGTRLLRQDLHLYEAELSKRSATGGEFALRKIVDYDQNNSPGNADPNLPWSVQMEAEFRQPMLQGAGVDFNQIAGPGGVPGAMGGVLIARINTDISLADFEVGVRNLINDTENAYWELYFAYRDLDSKTAARDRALETWRRIHALFITGRRGGEADKEAQAREQYFRLEEEVQNALTGRLEDRIRTAVFRGAGGVHRAERRLRLLMGAPVNDGRLIRPADEPLMAKVVFDWQEVLVEALNRRVELRRQKWQIERRELELIAARNFLLPRVDAVGRYRFRGLGHDLLNPTRQPSRFDNAYQDLTTGDFQEWQLGVEVTIPIGYRQAHAAVRNTELLLTRDQAILEAQEKEISHDLSAAIAELERAYHTSQTNYNRRIAARQQLAALESNYQDADERDKNRLLDLLLDAQRRLTDAETKYYRSLVEYTLSIKNVHLQKGSLLEYNQVYLAEGPWPDKAYADARRRDARRRNPHEIMSYTLSRPRPIGRGGHPPMLEPDQQDAPPRGREPLETPAGEPAVEYDSSAHHPPDRRSRPHLLANMTRSQRPRTSLAGSLAKRPPLAAEPASVASGGSQPFPRQPAAQLADEEAARAADASRSDRGAAPASPVVVRDTVQFGRQNGTEKTTADESASVAWSESMWGPHQVVIDRSELATVPEAQIARGWPTVQPIAARPLRVTAAAAGVHRAIGSTDELVGPGLVSQADLDASVVERSEPPEKLGALRSTTAAQSWSFRQGLVSDLPTAAGDEPELVSVDSTDRPDALLRPIPTEGRAAEFSPWSVGEWRP